MRTDVESYPGGVLMGGMSLKDPYLNIAHRRMWRCNGEGQCLFSSLLDALLVVLMAGHSYGTPTQFCGTTDLNCFREIAVFLSFNGCP